MVAPQLKSSPAASALLLSTTTMNTIFRPLHHPQLAPVSPAAPTALLPVPPVLSAITAHPAQLWAAHVNVTVSLAEGIVSSLTVEVLAVVTVTIPALAAPQVARRTTAPLAPAPEDTES